MKDVIPLYTPECRECEYCLNPKTNLCQKIRSTQGQGLMPDGTSRFTTLDGRPIRGGRSDKDGRVLVSGLVGPAPGDTVMVWLYAQYSLCTCKSQVFCFIERCFVSILNEDFVIMLKCVYKMILVWICI